jgi:hypothetical protein
MRYPQPIHTQRALGALVGAVAADALATSLRANKSGADKEIILAPVPHGQGEFGLSAPSGESLGEFSEVSATILRAAESILRSPELERSNKPGVDHVATSLSPASQTLLEVIPRGIAAARISQDLNFEAMQHNSGGPKKEQDINRWPISEAIRRLIVTNSSDFLSQALSLISTASPPDEWPDASGTVPLNSSMFWDEKQFGYIERLFHVLKEADDFQSAIFRAIELSDGDPTLAALTGSIAGAQYGIPSIPSRWSTYLHGSVHLPDGTIEHYRLIDIQNVARQLFGKRLARMSRLEDPITPHQVHPLGVFASNLPGAPSVDRDAGVVSLCRCDDFLLSHPYRREIFLIDDDNENPFLKEAVEDAVQTIEAFLDEGRQVLVHCHGGRSRTSFVLKAWYMRRFGATHNEAESWLEGTWTNYQDVRSDFRHLLKTEW